MIVQSVIIFHVTLLDPCFRVVHDVLGFPAFPFPRFFSYRERGHWRFLGGLLVTGAVASV